MKLSTNRAVFVTPIFIFITAFSLTAAGKDKMVVCHSPPGNPDNLIEIFIAEDALTAHLAQHPEDKVGVCAVEQCLSGAYPDPFPGTSCWDLDGNGCCDPNEDVDGEAGCSASDCAGPSGEQGPQGIPGTDGIDGQDGAQGEQGESSVHSFSVVTSTDLGKSTASCGEGAVLTGCSGSCSAGDSGKLKIVSSTPSLSESPNSCTQTCETIDGDAMPTSEAFAICLSLTP